MRKLFTFFFMAIFALGIAQTHRFIYEYKFLRSPESKEHKTVNMALDVNPTDVKFYNYINIVNDSLNKMGNRNYSWNGTPALKRKKNSSENLNYEMMKDYFSYKTQDPIQWTLGNETKKSGEYTLQKATTNFGGRDWTAWFCKEVQISEGPYKFRGLPGLIFEVEDSQGTFSFKLLKSQKLNKTYETVDFLETFAQKKPVEVNLATLHKMMLEFYDDPMREIRDKFDEMPVGTFQVGGQKVTSKDQLKDMAKVVQEHIRKNYNPIDLTKSVNYPVN